MIDMNQREKRLRILASETVLLLLLGAMVVVGCEGSRSDLHNRADTSPEATTKNAGDADDIASLSTDGLVMSMGGEIPGMDGHYSHVHVPARMHQEGLGILAALAETRPPKSEYVRVQRRWLQIEDGYIAVRVKDEFWPRYQLLLFDLENNEPTAEILYYRQNAPDPRVTDDDADEIPPVTKGTAINLKGKAARQVYGFFAEALRDEEPQAADWFRRRLWLCRLEMLSPWLLGTILLAILMFWWRGKWKRKCRSKGERKGGNEEVTPTESRLNR